MKLIVSSPPHWHNDSNVSKVHFFLILALLPVAVFSVFTYGMHAARVISVAISTAVISEILIRRLFRKPASIEDGSAIFAGLLFALIMPASAPYWLIISGTFLGILVGKEIFGGLGCYPFNPVIVGWALSKISWPNYFNYDLASAEYNLNFDFRYPLYLLKKGGVETIADIGLVDLFFGQQAGGLGSGAVFLLLLGGLFVIYKGVYSWETPVSFAAGMVFMSTIFWLVNADMYANPLFHLLTGNAMIGIFFLATDFSSSPFTKWGKIVFGLSIGILTIILRAWSNYPDGVFFAILIMNLFTPLLDRINKKPTTAKVIML